MPARSVHTLTLIALGVIPIPLASARAWAGFCGCNSGPGGNEVQLFTGRNFSGACFTLQVGDTVGSLSATCGLSFSNAISSLRVGSEARLLTYGNASFAGQTAVYEAGAAVTAGIGPPDSSSIGSYAEDDFESLVVQPGGQPPQARVAWVYKGNDPSDAGTFFSEEVQGLCHTQGSWFITRNNNNQVWKVPFEQSLGASSCTAPGCDGSAFGNPRPGYDHFGDPDCSADWVLVPNTGPGQIPVAEVYRASDMAYMGGWLLAASNYSAWVALRPGTFDPGSNTQELWVGLQHVRDGNGIHRYRVHLSLEAQPDFLGDGPTLISAAPFGGTINNDDEQGGVFSSDGTTFFLSVGFGGGHNQIFAFQPDGLQVGRSGNRYGPFNFEVSSSCPFGQCEEPEGLDWLDTGMFLGGVQTQLHVILLDNNIGSDSFWLKHYSVN